MYHLSSTEVLGWLLAFEAGVWCDRGDFPRAARLARESLEIAERIESTISRALPLGTLSRVRAAEGDLDGALELAEEYLAASATTSRVSVPYALNDLARLRSARGERALARRLATEALEVSQTEGFLGGQLGAEMMLGRIELDDAKPADAAPWLERAQATLQATGFFVMRPELEELRAELARQAGDAPARERALREALRLYREMGAGAHVERLARALAGEATAPTA